MQQPPNQFTPQYQSQPYYPPQQQPQYPQQWQQPQQQLNEQSEIVLSRREILSPYHVVELYDDGAVWIIDVEEPPIEIKLESQAVQRLRDFLMQPNKQHYETANSYQQTMNPMPTPAVKPPVKRLIKRENDSAIAWLLFFWPVGLYMMWKYATWPDIVKGFITLALVAITLILLLHGFA